MWQTCTGLHDCESAITGCERAGSGEAVPVRQAVWAVRLWQAEGRCTGGETARAIVGRFS
jgi:hypothetical protein